MARRIFLKVSTGMLKKALLNMTLEFGPIVGFLILVENTDFFVATGWFVAFTILSLLVAFVKRGSFALFPFIVAATVIIFGTLTIYFQDPFFFIFKDTLYNFLFGAAIYFFLSKNIILLKIFFGETFALSDQGWITLSKRWAVFFFLLALSNECVRQFITPEQWAVYKIYSTLATTVFGLYQFTLVKKHRLPEASLWGLHM